MGEKYLPIGSIVILKKSGIKVMITGYFCVVNKRMYEYSGHFYPEGVTDPKKTLFFDKKDIKKTLFLGLQDEEYDEYEKKLENISNKYKDIMFKIANRMIYKALDGDINERR